MRCTAHLDPQLGIAQLHSFLHVVLTQARAGSLGGQKAEIAIIPADQSERADAGPSGQVRERTPAIRHFTFSKNSAVSQMWVGMELAWAFVHD